jgi:NhaP-type Na+/H+ or K+/H+ antiporter
MIARLSAGIVGTLAFLGMLLTGYTADNPLTTILIRAIVGLGLGCTLGYLGGHIAQVVVDDAVAKMAQAAEDAELAEAAAEAEAAGATES